MKGTQQGFVCLAPLQFLSLNMVVLIWQEGSQGLVELMMFNSSEMSTCA